MPQLFGFVQRTELSLTLWLVPLLPLVAAFANALAGFTRTSNGSRAARRLSIGGFGALLGALLLAVWHVTKLFELSEGSRHLHWHGWQMVRLGSVSFDFGLALDPLSAAMILVVTLAGAFVHVRLTSRRGQETPSFLAFTCLHLAVFSMLLIALADGFVPMFFGWQGALLSNVLFLYSGRDVSKARGMERAFVLHRIGDIGLLAAMLVLLWGLGGKWLPDGMYQPDLHPRFVAVTQESSETSRSPETGDQAASLSFTAFPGARLDIDNAPLAHSPFVNRKIEAGRHSFLISPGDAEDQHEINWLVMKAKSDTTITPIGPTLVFRQIRDQLALRDGEGGEVLRDALSNKRLFGMSLLTLACLFLCLPILAQAAQLPLLIHRNGTSRIRFPAHAILPVLASICVMARCWFLFSMTNVTSELVAGLLSLSLILLLVTWRVERVERLQTS